MKVIRETCVAGKVIDVSVRVSSGNHRESRSGRRCITREAVQKNNDRIAAKKLGRMLNAYCNSSWCHDTLTYKSDPGIEQGMKIFKNFVDRLRRKMKKAGKDLMWVSAPEYTNRLHHHFITNAPVDMVREAWTEGIVLPRPMDDGPNYQRLAEYIIKETTETFRQEDCPFKTRYSHSRNMKVPNVQVEEVSEKTLFADPTPRKGYYIDQDTVRRFVHPITGLEHLEYYMISETEEPRIKKYYKGKKKKREEDYSRYINYEEKQLSFSSSYL
jgi:hypothetical protein